MESKSISTVRKRPSINVQGSNAATINVGDAYSDLGTIVHDNQGHDLSYRAFINGVLFGNILIDTSQAATDTIDYDATDTWGNTSTGTRAVIIDPSATPQQLKRKSVRYCLIGALYLPIVRSPELKYLEDIRV